MTRKRALIASLALCLARASFGGSLDSNGSVAPSSTTSTLPSVASLFPADGLSRIVPESLQCTLCRTATLVGRVGDCACDFETVDAATHSYFHPLLTKLQRTAFFRYFKVNLDKPCPFWDDSDEMCAMRACAVETCDPGDLPQPWQADEPFGGSAITQGVVSGDGSSLEEQSAKTTTAGADQDCAPSGSTSLTDLPMWNVERASGRSMEVEHWHEGQSLGVWIDQDEESSDMVYVDLLENPERFTGYSGASAARVWQAIHRQNCFDDDAGAGQCLEKRIFFRLISGLQASISTHIAREYYFGDYTRENGYWGQNMQIFIDRVGQHVDRLHNMYFTYLFMLRALAKAGPELELHPYVTGNATEDASTVGLVRALAHPDHPLVDSADAAQICQSGFDESRLFQTQGANPTFDELSELEKHLAKQQAADLRTEFQNRFRTISRIMDCVGCEKCRLWGKLQILGVGTALKILMTEDESISLQRNEVVAFINTLAQISRSVKSVNDWRQRELRHALQTLFGRLAIVILGPWLILKVLSLFRRKAHRRPGSTDRKES